MWKIYFFILWFVVGAQCSEDLQDILKSIFNEKYDKNIRPNFGERPVEVSVSAHILKLTKIDSSNQEFTVDFYFRQSWIDQRLSFMPRPKVQNLTLEGALIQKIWVPDTFFLNEVTSSFHSTTVTNELVRLKSNGDVTKSMRLTVTATCPMKLKEFPFDHPVCALHLESFSSPIQDIKYEWARVKPSVTFSVESTTAGDFLFSMFLLRQTSVPAVAPIVGSYSRLTLEIQLKRILGRYESEFYSPCLLLVLLAVSSFWFGSPKLSAATATLCLFALLVVENSQITQLKLPKWAEKTWLDCYTRLCITFVSFVIIANLLELNTPEEGQENGNVPAETDQSKEDVESPRENRLASVSREDAKLASTSDESGEFREQILVLKSKLLLLQGQFYKYVRLTQPYVKWGILGLFLISDFIYWKSSPGFHPLDESHGV